MKRWIQVAFFKALFISVVFYLICLIYGSVTRNPYKISLSLEVIFFLVIFVANLLEYLWRNRKK